MKNYLLTLALLISVFVVQIKAQNRTIVTAQNTEISDNLDLRVVASIFGDSRNLEDFERHLNDPRLQLSNLDLNNDGQVDYLRVIESVNKRTHIIIIQSVINRDLYQDVATIELQKSWLNNIRVQVVGNSFFYGPNYIYEPIYFNTPIIYNNFWISNYRPYCSNWSWNYYPNFYQPWQVHSVYVYRNNVNFCLRNYPHNYYNYDNYRRSSYLTTNFNHIRSNGFANLHPEYSFERRNSAVSNRYELDQIRNRRGSTVYNEMGNRQNRSSTNQEVSSQNRVNNLNNTNPARITVQRDYSQNKVETPRQVSPQRDYSQNRVETPRQVSPQGTYSQNRVETPRQVSPQRDYSQNRVETPRQVSPQRDYSQNRVETARQETKQSNEYSRGNSSNRNSDAATGGRGGMR